MYLNRILLLALVLLYVFSPLMADWVMTGGAQWYRPHMIWLAVITTCGIVLYRRHGDDA